MMEFIQDALDELIKEKSDIEAGAKLTREEIRNTAENREETLKRQADLGRSAMELESFQAYRDIIDPWVRLTIKSSILKLLITGHTMTEAELKTTISRIQTALTIPGILKKHKETAVNANKELERRENSKLASVKTNLELDERDQRRKEGVQEKIRERDSTLGKAKSRGKDTPVI